MKMRDNDELNNSCIGFMNGFIYYLKSLNKYPRTK